MRKPQQNKKLIYMFVAIIFLVAVVFWIKANTAVAPAKVAATTPSTTPATVPVSISSKKITETNFTGTVAVISGSSALAKAAQAYVDQAVADFKTQADVDVPKMRQDFGPDSPPATYEIDIDAKDVKGGATESIVMSEYAYTGGANGNSTYHVLTALASSGKILSLADVVTPSEQAAFTKEVQRELDAWQPQGSDAPVVFSDEVKTLTFSSFLNWSLDNQNLTIYFDKYEIGPGVLGPVAFPVPVKNIKDFLNPNF